MMKEKKKQTPLKRKQKHLVPGPSSKKSKATDRSKCNNSSGSGTIPKKEANPSKPIINPIVWKSAYINGRIKDFDYESAGIKLGPEVGKTECNMFKQLFTPQIIEHIVTCTNNFAISVNKNNKWKPVDSAEIEAFIGLHMLQSMCKKKI